MSKIFNLTLTRLLRRKLRSCAHSSVTSDLKKIDSFTLETSKNHLMRNFLRNGRLRVNLNNKFKLVQFAVKKRGRIEF